MMNKLQKPHRTSLLKGSILILTSVFLFVPFVDAEADPTPAPSASASASASGPTTSVLSAALFSGTTSVPTDNAWKDAALVAGVRMGKEAIKHRCAVKHISEWVRIECGDLSAGRADLVAGEKRDLKLLKAEDQRYTLYGDNVVAQFSMHSGDRRVIQWISSDLWWSVWQDYEGKMASGIMSVGALYGVVVQVDWASGPEPIIAVY